MLLLAQKRPTAAQGEFRAALRYDPHYVPARLHLGHAFVMQGDLDGALREYQAAMRIDPDNPDVHLAINHLFQAQDSVADPASPVEEHLHRATVLARCGRLDEAIELYQVALEARPDHAATLQALGDALAARGDVDAAIAAYRRSISADPTIPEVRNNLGVLLDAAGAPDAALAQYREGLRLAPAHADLQYNLRVTLTNRPPGADIDMLSAAYVDDMGLYPTWTHRRAPAAQSSQHDPARNDKVDALRHVNLGHTFFALGRIAEAREQYENALRETSRFPAVHYNLGRVYESEGQAFAATAAYVEAIDLAAEQYRAALQARPDEARHHNALGVLLFVASQVEPTVDGRKAAVEDALREFQRALEIDADYLPARINRATVLDAAGLWDGALEEYRAFLSGAWAQLVGAPTAIEEDLRYGLSDFGIAELQNVSAIYAEALRLYPDVSAVHEQAGAALAAEGRSAEAVSELREAVRLAPDSPETRLEFARVLRAANHDDEAVANFREVISTDSSHEWLGHPRHGEAHAALGTLLDEQGRADAAFREYRLAQRFDPRGIRANYLLAEAWDGRRSPTDWGFRAEIPGDLAYISLSEESCLLRILRTGRTIGYYTNVQELLQNPPAQAPDGLLVLQAQGGDGKRLYFMRRAVRLTLDALFFHGHEALPGFAAPLAPGGTPVEIRNPWAFPVVVGLRSPLGGVDLPLRANETRVVHVPAGEYQTLFRAWNEPATTYWGQRLRVATAAGGPSFVPARHVGRAYLAYRFSH